MGFAALGLRKMFAGPRFEAGPMTIDVQIRPYDVADEEGVVALWSAVFPNPRPGTNPDGREQHIVWLRSRRERRAVPGTPLPTAP
jgi:hypothetical protein